MARMRSADHRAAPAPGAATLDDHDPLSWPWSQVLSVLTCAAASLWTWMVTSGAVQRIGDPSEDSSCWQLTPLSAGRW